MVVYGQQVGAYVCETITELINIIQSYGNGFNDALIDAYLIPSAIIEQTSGTLQYPGQSSPKTIDKYITKPSTLNGYTPVNHKLLTFPFCFFNVDNNNGSTNSFYYELFNGTDSSTHSNDCKFTIKGVPVIGGSIKCNPVNYKTTSGNQVESEGLMAGKYPTLSWSEDEYTNWLTQNAVNIGVGITTDVLGFASSILTGNVATGVSSSLAIANRLGQFYQHSLVPYTAKGNTNGGDINTSSSANNFFFYKMSIRSEYARIIDDYFSTYGYKTNRMKIPNITGRTYWNYVEIAPNESIGHGSIPADALNTINDAFHTGVTIWHNHANVGNYELSNTIVTP